MNSCPGIRCPVQDVDPLFPCSVGHTILDGIGVEREATVHRRLESLSVERPRLPHVTGDCAQILQGEDIDDQGIEKTLWSRLIGRSQNRNQGFIDY